MINETVSIDDITDNGNEAYIHYTVCSISISGKGSKSIKLSVNLKSNEAVYNVYMDGDLVDTEKYLSDAVDCFNLLKVQREDK